MLVCVVDNETTSVAVRALATNQAEILRFAIPTWESMLVIFKRILALLLMGF
jgi:hypothetical protein